MKIFSFLTLATTTLAATIAKRGPKASDWDYENKTVNGVNLGGWFLLEPYITPSLFKAFEPGEIPVDEYHYTMFLGKEEAKRRLEHHWDTWYKESDFEAMANAGINTVRIPVGYWAYGMKEDDPYVLGQDFYLERALGWARKYGIVAWIDLHGAPGSQNGSGSSGLRGSFDSLEELRKSIGFFHDDNLSLTLTVLQKIFDKYGGSEFEDVVSGIELLNEPLGIVSDMNKLKNFYRWGYGNMRYLNSLSYNNVIISDAFMEEPGYLNDFMTVDEGYWKVVVDHHHYQWHTPEELGMNINEHVQLACELGTNHTKEYHWNIVGEWSAALTDCAMWLNGIGRGSRWLGQYMNSPKFGECEPYTNPDEWTEEHKQNLRRFIEGHIDAYSTASGWIFWNWKCENAVEWDMSRLIQLGVLPQPFSDRQYPNQCGYD